MFSREKADFLILETGLGGRLDATNIIRKSLIDIITPISIDHQEFLGEDILQITNEKLGIIKKESHIIVSKQEKIILSHIKKKLKNHKNHKMFIQKNFTIKDKNKKNFILRYNNIKNIFNKPKLLGNHQIENASTAIATILKLNELGYSISNKIINKGILNTKWPGRLEQGKLGNIKVYLDGAHNIDGAKQLLKYFKNKKLKVWLIIGMLNNKNIFNFLKKIKPILNGVIAVSIPHEKNTFTPKEIIKICDLLELQSFSQPSINKANQFLLKKIKPKVVLVSGSLYLVGKIREKYL